jgi:hypothetical protein
VPYIEKKFKYHKCIDIVMGGRNMRKKNTLFSKGLVFLILIVLTGTSIMSMASSLSAEKHVLPERPLADCSMVGDSRLSLITIKVISEMRNNEWYTNNVPFVITSESDEIASIYYSFWGEPFKYYTGPFNATWEGNNIPLWWYAVDHEGNKSEVDGPFVFDLDKTKPIVPEVIEYKAFKIDGKWYVTFNVTCTDATSGLDRVEWFLNQVSNNVLHEIDEGPGPFYEWTIPWSRDYESISYWFKATAYDKAGNSDSVIMDGDGISSSLEQSMFSTGIVKEDSHQRSQSGVSATERVGMEKELYNKKPKSDCSMAGDFHIASLVVVVNRKMLNDDWVDGNVSITLIPDSDITAVYYKLDDGEWILYDEPLVISEDGFHTFWWYIIDNEGNTSTPDSIVFNMDRTPPTIELTKEKLAINKIKFTATVNDATSGVDRVEFYVDGGLEANLSNPPYEWIYTGFRRHAVTAVVYDNVGNSNSSSMNTWNNNNQQFSNQLFFQIVQRLLNIR